MATLFINGLPKFIHCNKNGLTWTYLSEDGKSDVKEGQRSEAIKAANYVYSHETYRSITYKLKS